MKIQARRQSPQTVLVHRLNYDQSALKWEQRIPFSLSLLSLTLFLGEQSHSYSRRILTLPSNIPSFDKLGTLVPLGGNIQPQQRLERLSHLGRAPWRGTKADVTGRITNPAPQGTEARGAEVTCPELPGRACRLCPVLSFPGTKMQSHILGHGGKTTRSWQPERPASSKLHRRSCSQSPGQTEHQCGAFPQGQQEGAWPLRDLLPSPGCLMYVPSPKRHHTLMKVEVIPIL